MTWDVTICSIGAGSNSDEDGTALLPGLADGSYSIVVLKGLIPTPELERNSVRIHALFDRAVTTVYPNGRLTTVGPYLAKYAGDRNAYFGSAARAACLMSDAAIDLAELTRRRLADVLGLASFNVATEHGGACYASHNIRIYCDDVETPLHNDNIIRDMAGCDLALSSLTSHFSCVVCVQECDDGGHLELYRKTWEPADEQYKIVGGFGYEMAVVEGVECRCFKPETGDVYLFDPRQYHAIERVGGRDRVTLGFFFGFRDQAPDDAIAWV